ncbi:MAG: hypothetical protein WDN23_10310 [Edaphobacter sp.]
MSSENSEKIETVGRSNKTEAVQIRFDARRRFVLEMAARRFNMPLSTLLEEVAADWLVNSQPTILREAEEAFSPFVADRFVMQATVFPDTLTDLERLLWARIKREDSLWYGETTRPCPQVTHDNFDFELLRGKWEEFVNDTLQCKEAQEFHNHLLKSLKVRIRHA